MELEKVSFTSLLKQSGVILIAAYFITQLVDSYNIEHVSIVLLVGYVFDKAYHIARYRYEVHTSSLEQERDRVEKSAKELQMVGEQLAAEKRAGSERANGYKLSLADFEQTIAGQKRLISELEAELERAKADKRQLDNARLYKEINDLVEGADMPVGNKTHAWIVSVVTKAVNQSVIASQNGKGGRAS